MKTQLCFALALLVGIASSFHSDAQGKSGAAAKPRKAARGPFVQVEDVEGLPRVLLIGDSISIGYTLQVRKLLAGKANVHRPPTNCGPTTRGLEQIDSWLAVGGAGKKWDVIHFNWGLHDLKYMGPNGKNLADPKSDGSFQQVPPADYEKNLRKLVKRLGKTGAKLIWRNTTPVPKGCAGRIPGDAANYNALAAKVMKEHGIPTDDLFAFCSPQLAKIQRPANVHFTPEGSQALAGEVAATIAKALAKE